MNSGDSWFNQTFEFGGFAEVFQNSGCRGNTWARSFFNPLPGFPPWQSVHPRTTCGCVCIGSTPAWHWMQPDDFASAAACDWSMRFGLGREAGEVTEKFGGRDV